MRTRDRKRARNTAKRSRRMVIGIVVAGIALAFGTMAVVSMKAGSVSSSAGKAKNSINGKVNETYLASVNGQVVKVNSQTGQFTPLTAEEARKMYDAIRQLANQSAEGLQQVQHADGSVSMDLEGHFQNVAMARKTSDGTVEQACVDNPQSAAEFLGIKAQPKDSQAKSGAPVSQSASRGGEIR